MNREAARKTSRRVCPRKTLKLLMPSRFVIVETGAGMGESYLDRYRGQDRGYVERPNGAIVADVRAALDACDALDARSLAIDARHDEVTLRGSVATVAMRAHAVQLARAVPGVALVHDLLAVRGNDA
jgi:osmotically-inducible protein OsmY